MSLRVVRPLLIIALLVSASSAFADPPVSPPPPSGYQYGSLTVDSTSFNQSLGSEVYANAGFDSWSGDNPVGWTVSETAQNYVTQSGSAAQIVSSASLSPQLTQTAGVPGTWYAVEINISSFSSGQFRTNFLGGANTLLGGSGIFRFLRQATPGTTSITTNGTSTHNFVLDSYSARPITFSAPVTASADGTHTLSFSLPTPARFGDQIWLVYRYQDQSNFWAARLIRSSANWDVSLVSVVGAVPTVHSTVFNVGATDALRVMVVGNTHTLYSGNAGTFTQRGSVITSASLNNQAAVTVLHGPGFTPGRLVSYSIVPIPTVTPTPAATSTPTLTPLPSATPTITPTPSPTPTPDIFAYWTLEPSGHAVRMAYRSRPGDAVRVPLLVGILVSIWAILFLLIFLRVKSNG
ncbi:MAG: hypothetical protein SF162_07615 [bacterium]|nr:hypothetical protein [bacterium]